MASARSYYLRSLPVAGNPFFLKCMQPALSHTARVRSQMTEKRYSVRIGAPQQSVYVVMATTAEVYGEHLVFLNAKGQPLFLFLLEIVESWSEPDP
jgi:hypothetical protein